MKDVYGFRLSDKTGEYVRWRTSNGVTTCNDGKSVSLYMAIAIRTQEFYDFRQAYACAKAAAKEYNLQFDELTEEDWNKNKPLKQLFKILKDEIHKAFNRNGKST